MAAFSPMPSKLWTPKQTLTVAQNLSRAYLNAPPEALQHGAQFYPEWEQTAQHIGQEIGQGQEAGSALLAHLSPATEAEMNRIMGLQLVHGGLGSSRQMSALRSAAAAAVEAKGFKARETAAKKSGDTRGAARWNAEYEKAKASAQAHRRRTGIGGTPLGTQASGAILNALNIREGNVADPLGSLGDIKIGDFGRMINDPYGYERPPIDTHYHDVGVGRTDIPYATSRGLSSKGRYEAFQTAHRQAHAQTVEELGIDPSEIPHSAFMGGIWYAQQMRKAVENPDSMKARLASITKLSNIRRNAKFAPYLPESHGLSPAFAKVGT
jgi:hypothetical protein